MSPSLRRLDGRVAAVTGAGGEIGRGICSELAREGASIAALDLDGKAARETMHAVVRQFKVKATAIRMDVTLGRSIKTAVKRITEELGATEILVNNAGVLTLSPLLELPEKEWDFVMNVNAKGVFLCSKIFAGEMVRRKAKGSIVNISSIAGKVPLRDQVHYCASKAAVIAITKVSALELASHHIRVNAVCPGAVDTEMFSGVVEDVAKKEGRQRNAVVRGILANIGIRRLIEPEEVGRVVAFLCSDEAAVISGQAINADGGNFTVNY